MLVCAKALEAAASVLCTSNLALEVVLHFVSALPREATDYGGERTFLHFFIFSECKLGYSFKKVGVLKSL